MAFPPRPSDTIVDGLAAGGNPYPGLLGALETFEFFQRARPFRA